MKPVCEKADELGAEKCRKSWQVQKGEEVKRMKCCWVIIIGKISPKFAFIINKHELNQWDNIFHLLN